MTQWLKITALTTSMNHVMQMGFSPFYLFLHTGRQVLPKTSLLIQAGHKNVMMQITPGGASREDLHQQEP